MQVQDIVNASSTDIRSVLASTGTDANVFIPWVDQVHKDVLHTSMYAPLNAGVQTVDTTLGTSSYALQTPVRRISLLYDRTFDHILTPMDGMGFPTQKADSSPTSQAPMPEAMLSSTTSTEWPSFFRRIGNNQLIIFPAPQKAPFLSTLEVHYEGYVADLTALTSALIVPSDGIDLIVAGVNMKACQFLKLPAEAQMWQQVYEQKKNGSPQT